MAKILIVDDSLVMRKNLKTILTKAGHEIAGEANNGSAGVQLYKELQPDVVTMDISMPTLSGIEAVEQIIEEYPEAKIIMVSAVNQKHMVFQAIEKGAKHYVVKPINEVKLISIIDQVMEEDMEEKEIQQETIQGFDIENVQGVFVVKFNEHLSAKDYNLLKTAIQGILFIKPLNLQFDFHDVETIPEDVFEQIIRLGKDISENNGANVEFLSNIEAIRAKF